METTSELPVSQMPAKREFVRRNSWLVLLLPIALIGLWFATYPFSDEVARKTLSTEGLSRAQKANIQLAARSIDGVVLRPGEEFSFNKVVGPRTEARGYLPAPSYLGPENMSTLGGGICLMSSAVYQLALQSGCQIDERFPHLRTIHTVPPGLDATVWYGRCDLRFKNCFSYPVQLTTTWTNSTISISIRGRKDSRYKQPELQRVIVAHTTRDVLVELFRRQDGKESLISRDHYALSQ